MKRMYDTSKLIAIFIAIGAIILNFAVCVTSAQDAKSPLLVRIRAIAVQPDESSSVDVIGGEATVDDSVTPELDISYFFADHIAAELVLAVTRHDVAASDTTLGAVDLGDVRLLPPALVLQYHLMPDRNIRPYAGAGINYTMFFDENSGPVATSINYDDGFGWVLQTGVDVAINDHWAVNLDAKKLYLNTDVEIEALGSIIKADVDLDPWIFGAGVSYRF